MTDTKPPGSKPDPKTAPEPAAPEIVRHEEDLLDEALEESFPASDPPSIPSLHDLERRSRDRKPGG